MNNPLLFCAKLLLTNLQQRDKMAGRVRSLRAEFLLCHNLQSFVKRNVRKNCTNPHPEICAICMLTFMYGGAIMYLQGKEREGTQNDKGNND